MCTQIVNINTSYIKDQKKATNIGLILAMALRLLLLLGITILIGMSKPWIEFHNSYMHGAFSGQSIILILGGLFLLYKSVTEIHHKLEGEEHGGENGKSKKSSLGSAIVQITLINIVFSFDSILTAVGMTISLLVEVLNMKMRKNKKPVQLNNAIKEAKNDGIL